MHGRPNLPLSPALPSAGLLLFRLALVPPSRSLKAPETSTPLEHRVDRLPRLVIELHALAGHQLLKNKPFRLSLWVHLQLANFREPPPTRLVGDMLVRGHVSNPSDKIGLPR